MLLYLHKRHTPTMDFHVQARSATHDNIWKGLLLALLKASCAHDYAGCPPTCAPPNPNQKLHHVAAFITVQIETLIRIAAQPMRVPG